MYGITTEELAIRVIRIDEAAGRGDSDSQMTSFEVIMPLKLQSSIKRPIVRCIALFQLLMRENE